MIVRVEVRTRVIHGKRADEPIVEDQRCDKCGLQASHLGGETCRLEVGTGAGIHERPAVAGNPPGESLAAADGHRSNDVRFRPRGKAALQRIALFVVEKQRAGREAAPAQPGQQRRRLSLAFDPGLLRRMTRFGLPTMPAELTLYSLNFVDRIIIVRLAGLAEAGLYALAVKFAQADHGLGEFRTARPDTRGARYCDGRTARSRVRTVAPR